MPVMGVNSTNAVNSSSTTSILPGFGNFSINPDYPVDRATNINFTIEQPLKVELGHPRQLCVFAWQPARSVLLLQQSPLQLCVGDAERRNAVPSGGSSVIGTSAANTYSSTATGPYDQTTWGGNSMSQKSGWSNDNQLQVSYQKLYHHGIAWQVMFDWQKNLRNGGNWSRDNQVDPYENYLTTAAANTTFGYPFAPPSYRCWLHDQEHSGHGSGHGDSHGPAAQAAHGHSQPGPSTTRSTSSRTTAPWIRQRPKKQLQYTYIIDLPYRPR